MKKFRGIDDKINSNRNNDSIDSDCIIYNHDDIL